MATYLHPGVYVEEIPGGSKPIEGRGDLRRRLTATMVGGNDRVYSLARDEPGRIGGSVNLTRNP